MRYIPNAIFVVDVKLEKNAVDEAKILGIPVFGIVDTNTNPESIDYPIPANDDSIKTVKLILSYFVDSINDLTTMNKEGAISDDVEKSDKSEEKKVEE